MTPSQQLEQAAEEAARAKDKIASLLTNNGIDDTHILCAFHLLEDAEDNAFHEAYRGLPHSGNHYQNREYKFINEHNFRWEFMFVDTYSNVVTVEVFSLDRDYTHEEIKVGEIVLPFPYYEEKMKRQVELAYNAMLANFKAERAKNDAISDKHERELYERLKTKFEPNNAS